MTTDVSDVLTEAEHAVIRAVLVENDSFDLIDLRADEFWYESHRIIFAEVCAFLANGKSVDYLMLAESLESSGKLKSVGGLQYLGAVVGSIYSTKRIASYAAIVRREYQRRTIKASLIECLNRLEGRDDVGDVLSELDESLTRVVECSAEQQCLHVSDVLKTVLENRKKGDNFIQTGFSALDSLLSGGIRGSNLIVLAGRPSMGKTAFAYQIAEHVARQSSVVFFSLEMGANDVVDRSLSSHYSRPNVDEDDVHDHISSLNLHIDPTSAVDVRHIGSLCRKHKRKHNLDLVVVDYIQLMTGKGDNRTQEMGSISRGLKALAKDLDVPVIALSQLNRKLEDRPNKRPVMSDIRESGEIEQDADVILFIYRDDVYDSDTPDQGLAEIICRKQRNGRVGTVYLDFVPNETRFYNTERRPVGAKPKRVSVGLSSYQAVKEGR